MAKTPSVETRSARADLRTQGIELARANQQRDAYRNRATQAEQECAEWKQRFDILLRRDDPKST